MPNLTRFVVFLVATMSASGFAANVRFEVTPNPEFQTVGVKVFVEGLQLGERPVVEIAKRYASVDDYYADVEGLKIDFPKGNRFQPHKYNGELVEGMWEAKKKLSSTSFSYSYQIRVNQKISGEVTRFKPAMNFGAYYSNGFPLFIYPNSYVGTGRIDVEDFLVEFDLPENWQAITSFQKKSGEHRGSSYDEIAYSSIALGQYRKLEKQLTDYSNLVVAIEGDWTFTDEELVDSAHKIILAQIDLMGTWHKSNYTITLSPNNSKGSTSGSGLTNAFEMFAHPSAAIEDLYFLVGHENFHYWNGHRINYESPKNRWFSEGFTNYYTVLFLARGGVLERTEAFELFSDLYQTYYHSPLSTTIDFVQAGKYFWDWREYSRIFYTKGMLIGLMVDVKLRSGSFNTKSLDGLMKVLDSKLSGTNIELNNAVFLREINEYSGLNWQEFISENILGSTLLKVNETIVTGGMELASEDCLRPDHGMYAKPYFCENGEACDYVAANVAVDGPAYEAGLRDGERVLEKHYSERQANSSVWLRVLSKENQERIIEYRSGEKLVQCLNFRFTEETSGLGEDIRRSIWETRSF